MPRPRASKTRGRRAAIGAVFVAAVGCSASNGDGAAPASWSDTSTAAVEQRDRAVPWALAACFASHGIDAVVEPDGAVLSDRRGKLSREESFALSEECWRQITDAGIFVVPEVDAESRRRDYERYQRLRSCLVGEGFSVPELVSFEVFLDSPDEFTHPLEWILRTEGVRAFQDGEAACVP